MELSTWNHLEPKVALPASVGISWCDCLSTSRPEDRPKITFIAIVSQLIYEVEVRVQAVIGPSQEALHKSRICCKVVILCHAISR